MDLSTIQRFLFDIDGVFLAGKKQPRLISGQKILSALRARDLPFRLITNTSTHPPEFYRRLAVETETCQRIRYDSTEV